MVALKRSIERIAHPERKEKKEMNRVDPPIPRASPG
jgi:hypothetical protein